MDEFIEEVPYQGARVQKKVLKYMMMYRSLYGSTRQDCCPHNADYRGNINYSDEPSNFGFFNGVVIIIIVFGVDPDAFPSSSSSSLDDDSSVVSSMSSSSSSSSSFEVSDLLLDDG